MELFWEELAHALVCAVEEGLREFCNGRICKVVGAILVKPQNLI